MKLTTLPRVVLALAAAMIAGSVQAQVTAYSPGRSFDQHSWALFVEVVKPAVSPNLNGPLTFETWATDEDTFDTTTSGQPANRRGAQCPAPFPTSALGLARAHLPNGLQGALPNQNEVAATCVQPANAAAGNYPTPFVQSPPANCVAEEVRRNRKSFNFIVSNGLYSQAGLQEGLHQPQPHHVPETRHRNQNRLGSGEHRRGVAQSKRRNGQRPTRHRWVRSAELLRDHAKRHAIRVSLHAHQFERSPELALGHVRAPDEPGPLRYHGLL